MDDLISTSNIDAIINNMDISKFLNTSIYNNKSNNTENSNTGNSNTGNNNSTINSNVGYINPGNDNNLNNNNSNSKINIPNSVNLKWDPSMEQIFAELADEAQINSFLHKKAHHYYKYRNIKYQLPVILFSALSGSGNFISTYFPNYTDKIVLGIGFISIFISIISSTAQYLKLSELSEGNRISYISWEKFFINIKFQLRRKRDSRDNIKEFLNQIIPEYQRLKEISPEIPSDIVSQLKTKKNFNRMNVPVMFNGFHPFKPYLTKSEISKDENEIYVNNNYSHDKIEFTNFNTEL